MIEIPATEFKQSLDHLQHQTIAITDQDHAIGYLMSEQDYREYLLLRAKALMVKVNLQRSISNN